MQIPDLSSLSGPLNSHLEPTTPCKRSSPIQVNERTARSKLTTIRAGFIKPPMSAGLKPEYGTRLNLPSRL